jgi:cytochrome P450
LLVEASAIYTAAITARDETVTAIAKTKSNTITAQFDPRWPALITDPYPIYQQYRDSEPVHWGVSPDPRFPGSWFVFGYAEASEILRDPRFDNDMRKYLPPSDEVSPDPVRLSAMDPPEHTRMREVIMEAFTVRRTEALRRRVLAMIDSQIARIRDRDEMDVVADYAMAVPIAVIADLLGVPESDRETLRRLADVVMHGYDIGGNLDQVRSAAAAADEFAAYFDGLVARRAPGDGSDDLIQHLIRAREQGRLAPREVLDVCRFMVIAGFETTLNLIGTGLYHLMAAPAQLAVLRSDVRGLISSATEELLRMVSPVQRVDRFAREDVTIAGRVIEKGDSVRVMLGAANHDGRQFPDPERLDVTRNPGRVLAFGFGRHLCSGASLARMEAQEAIAAFITRLPHVALHPSRKPAWRRMLMTRGLATLPAVRRL